MPTMLRRLPRARCVRCFSSRSTPPRVTRGAAVLMAMFVATLAVLIVDVLFRDQFTLLRTIENQELVAQSRLLLRSGLDWSRAILREDARVTNVDHNDEAWAKGLAESQLKDLGETSALASRASIAGSIEDAQSRLNLRNLINAQFEVDQNELVVLQRLLAMRQIPSGIADLIAARMQQAFAPATESSGPPAARPIPLVLPQDLAGIPGIDPEVAAQLAKFVVVLDAPNIAVNVNTAQAEVIAARVPDMLLSDANALVRDRDGRGGYFLNTGDLQNRINGIHSGLSVANAQLATTSRYFIVRGQVKLDRAVTRVEALVKREASSGGGRVTVLWQREL